MIQQFEKYLTSEKRNSPHTVIAYINDVEQFEQYLLVSYHDSDFTKVTHHYIRSWVVKLSTERIGAKTINRKLSALKTFFKYLRQKDLVKRDPTQKIQSLKNEKRLPSYIPEKDLLKLLDQTDKGKDFVSLRDRLIIELLYQTGIRRAELLSLKINDISRDMKMLKIIGKGNKQRNLPISNQLLELWDTYVKLRNETFPEITNNFLLCTKKGVQFYPKLLYNIVKRYLSVLPQLEKASPHILRHSFATHLTNNGAELNAVKELLGHANLSATQIYTHNAIDKLKKAYKQAHPKS